MDYKQQALEAARPFAHDFDDLLVKAAKIEAYLLGTTSLTTAPPALPEPETVIDDDGKALIDDYARELLSMAKGLTGDLAELGFTEPNEAYTRFDAESRRLKELSEAVAHCDLATSPPVRTDNEYAESRRMENFEIKFRHRGGQYTANLRPIQLQLGRSFEKHGVIVNVSRQMGSTTLVAAFAREMKSKGHRVLVLTNTYSNAVVLNEMIDDAAVNVYDFAQIAKMSHAGEHYDYIVIDNASFIPYATEDRIRDYVRACEDAHLAWETNTYAPGFESTPTKVIMISVPGQERGWFYEACTSSDPAVIARKITGDWRWSDMTPAEAVRLKAEIGDEVFANQFENKFRPVEQPNGTTDLTL